MASSSNNNSGRISSSSDSRFLHDVAYNGETARARDNGNSEDEDASFLGLEPRKRPRSIEREPSFNQNSVRGEHNSGDLGTIVDRDGRHHKWKDTKNIPARTKKLQVLFRIVSHRRIHLYAPYGTFEATDYLTAIQFASTDRDIDDYAILKDSGLLHRIRDLKFLSTIQSFEDFMQLCFKNDSSNSTLSTDSFSLNGDIIHPTAVPTQIFRLTLAQALRHLQIAFIVFFSSIFGLCLNEIIDALEGKLDPFRVIKDDLLHHLVSLVLSKWSWYVKTEYRAPRHPKINLKNPSGCAKLLQQMFKDQLILGLTSFDAYNEELLFRNQQTPYAQLAPTPKVPITMV